MALSFQLKETKINGKKIPKFMKKLYKAKMRLSKQIRNTKCHVRMTELLYITTVRIFSNDPT